MRLLIDLQGAQNDSRFRGIGRYVNSLLLHLISTRSPSDEVVLLLNGQLIEGERDVRRNFAGLIEQGNILVWQPIVPASWESSANLSRRLASQKIREWAIAKAHPDCVLISSLFEGCGDNVVTSIPVEGQPPVAVIFYDLIPYLFPDQYLGNAALRGWYGEKLQYLKRADLLLAISEASRVDAMKYLELPDRMVCNISSGIDVQTFKPVETSWPELAQKFEIPGRYLLYVGAADPRKNLTSMIGAYGRLLESNVGDVSLVMVGALVDSQKADFRKLLPAAPNRNRQLIFAGQVSDGELIALYHNALALVFPSLYEGFGLPLLEAMAVGCPVIASNCSAFPEVVGIEEALFDPLSEASMAELMQRVIVDLNFRQRLRREQGKRVSLFSWEEVANRAWEHLRQLAGSKTGVADMTWTSTPIVTGRPDTRRTMAVNGEGRSDQAGASEDILAVESLIASVAEQLRSTGASISDFAQAAEAIVITRRGMSLVGVGK